MTREEAINIMSQMIKDEVGFLSDNTVEAHKMAIKALKREHCEDAISRQKMLKYFEGWKNQIKYYHPYAKNFDIPYEEAIQWVKELPPVNPQKPICPSAGVDCEDCPAYEKKSEWEHDHEILKAYSDGANAVLDKIRAEIEQTEINGHIRDVECFRAGINVALNVIDKYIEGSDT